MNALRTAAEKTSEGQRGVQRHATALQSMPVTVVEGFAFIQRTTGNQAVLRLLRARHLQPKLTVSRPDVIHEQEADRVADEVMRMPDAAISDRQSGVNSGNGVIQTKPG